MNLYSTRHDSDLYTVHSGSPSLECGFHACSVHMASPAPSLVPGTWEVHNKCLSPLAFTLIPESQTAWSYLDQHPCLPERETEIKEVQDAAQPPGKQGPRETRRASNARNRAGVSSSQTTPTLLGPPRCPLPIHTVGASMAWGPLPSR